MNVSFVSLFDTLRLKRLHATFVQAVEQWRIRIETSLARRRGTVAVIISLGLHGLLFSLLLIGAQSTRFSGGAGGVSAGLGTGTGLSVELMSTAETVPDALQIKPSDPTDFTTPELSSAASMSPLDVSETQVVANLANQTAEVGNASATAPESQAEGGAGQGGQSSGVNDDALWSQIEPCWRRLAASGVQGVRMRISFSALGNVAQTVPALEPEGAANAKSQATAIEALAECGPYANASSRENVVIAFPAL
jgi:hypothetical protein